MIKVSYSWQQKEQRGVRMRLLHFSPTHLKALQFGPPPWEPNMRRTMHLLVRNQGILVPDWLTEAGTLGFVDARKEI